MAKEQKQLPGMENREIAELESAAYELHDVRTKRISLQAQEKDRQDTVLRVMKKNGKTVYRHGRLHIQVVVEKEKAQIKVSPESKPKQKVEVKAKKK